MNTPLAAYMAKAAVKDADLAKLIARHRSIVSKIRRGKVKPTLDVAREIEKATGGEVPMQAWAA